MLSRACYLTHTFSQVELKKAQTEAQTSVESAASIRSTTLNKDVKPEGRPGVKLAGVLNHMNYNSRNTYFQYVHVQQHDFFFLSESSPTKVPERPREEKWLRKNVASSSPSSSPESGQPSWMELAKRKSMAWSDKSMDWEGKQTETTIWTELQTNDVEFLLSLSKMLNFIQLLMLYWHRQRVNIEDTWVYYNPSTLQTLQDKLYFWIMFYVIQHVNSLC